jgi:hypothetical protein
MKNKARGKALYFLLHFLISKYIGAVSRIVNPWYPQVYGSKTTAVEEILKRD